MKFHVDKLNKTADFTNHVDNPNCDCAGCKAIDKAVAKHVRKK